MNRRTNHSFLTGIAAACLLITGVHAQSGAIANEMKTITSALEEAKKGLTGEPDTKAVSEAFAKVIAASERAQQLEPSGAAKATGARREEIVKSYRLHLKLMIDVVNSSHTALDLGQPRIAADLLKALDSMSSPSHSQPFK